MFCAELNNACWYKSTRAEKKMQLATQELDWLIDLWKKKKKKRGGNVPGGLACTQSHQQKNYCCGESQVSVNKRCWRKARTESHFHLKHLEVTKYFEIHCVYCVCSYSARSRASKTVFCRRGRILKGFRVADNQTKVTSTLRYVKDGGRKSGPWNTSSIFFFSLFGSFSLWCRANAELKPKNQTHTRGLFSNILSFLCVYFIFQFLLSLTEQSGLVNPRLSLSSPAYV